MKLRDITDVSKEEILSALGLAPKRSAGAWLLGSASLFGLGILVGAGVALILAPKSGRELRHDIGQRLHVRSNNGQTMETGM